MKPIDLVTTSPVGVAAANTALEALGRTTHTVVGAVPPLMGRPSQLVALDVPAVARRFFAYTVRQFAAHHGCAAVFLFAAGHDMEEMAARFKRAMEKIHRGEEPAEDDSISAMPACVAVCSAPMPTVGDA